MDTSKKFLFVNPDDTAGEVDFARMYPASSLRAVYLEDATSVYFLLQDAGQVDQTIVDITISTGNGKSFIKEFVEELNYGKEAVINLGDKEDGSAFSGLVDLSTAPAITEGS